MGVWNGVELDDLVLTGPRLTLRRWRDADADGVFEVMQDAHMHVFLNLPRPYTLEDAAAYVTRFGDEGRADGTGIGCAVVESGTGRLVGSAALRLPKTGTTAAEIGYWVGAPGRGRGYAAEASAVLTEWAFGHGLGRVQIRCAVQNLASARSALRAGFRFEAVLRAEGPTPAGPVDQAVFGRLAGDPGTPIGPWLPPLPDGGLTDGVVRLRVMTPADADVHERATLNRDARRWQFADSPLAGPELARAAARAELGWLVGPVGRLVIVDATTGAGAGTMALRDVGPPQVLNIGYGVLPEFRGRGFAGRALRLVADWAFGPADIARLELGTKIGNVASQKAAVAGGFQPDGVRVARLRNPDGTFSDEARYCLVNPRYVPQVARRRRP